MALKAIRQKSSPVSIRQKSSPVSIRPNANTIVLALIAALVVLIFRAEFHRFLPILGIETLIYFAMPVLVMGWAIRASQTKQILTSRKWITGLQTGILVFAFIPVVMQVIFRRVDIGDPFEVVALVMLLNACWFLAVFSRFGRFGRAAFAIGSALVLFICFMSQTPSIYVLAFLYALIALWWLLGNYWSRVKTKAIDVQSSALPIHGTAVIASIAAISVIGILAAQVAPSINTTAINGFMPASGGTSGWQDSYARSGIGDGEMLTAGQNAETTGAVDSDNFIEDDKPSMYDIMSETYDGPAKKKKKLNRAVELDDASAKHLEKIIQSEQSGKSFRTVRQPKEAKELDLDDRSTKALMFIEGQVPVRVTIDCFNHFDGWDWTKADWSPEDAHQPAINLESHFGDPWYVIKSVRRQYLSGHRAHRVKIMRLEDEVVPAPPLFKSWHIYAVDRKNMFYWDEQGLVRMGGELIPAHTMIDVVSQVPNFHTLRSSDNPLLVDDPRPWWKSIDSWLQVGTPVGTTVGEFSAIESDPNSPFIQQPDNETSKRLTKLTGSWISGLPEGWKQVEAIVDHFRTNFIVDPQALPPDDCEDSVGWFLDHGRGPDYLFATAAVQSLRSAGYRTRLASGFIATKDDYDRIAKQSSITADNLHMWPEVSLDGWHWLAVEPTPGYPMPYNVQTLWQRICAGISWFGYLIGNNPITSILILGLIGGIAYFRRSLLAMLGWMGWQIMSTFLSRSRLRHTRRLLDLRFWAADLPRPKYETPSKWYSQVDSELASRFIHLWRSNHFSSGFNSRTRHQDVYSACQEIVQKLTVNRIREFAAQNKNERQAMDRQTMKDKK